MGSENYGIELKVIDKIANDIKNLKEKHIHKGFAFCFANIPPNDEAISPKPSRLPRLKSGTWLEIKFKKRKQKGM